MLFHLYYPGPIPHFGYDIKDLNKNRSQTTKIIGSHSEIPRPEYSYVWNSDGLRSVEFNTEPEIIALGCSLTLGQGLPLDHIWTEILGGRLNKAIGNISYSGSSASKNVSSFFGLINKYKYKPKMVIANFANLERLYFVNEHDTNMRDWFLNKPKTTKEHAPWEYDRIIPISMAYYTNLDHIKMLEVFCNMNDIKLIWSTWSSGLTEDMENFLTNNFNNYLPDVDRKLFPTNFEFGPPANYLEDLDELYDMINWKDVGCHSEYKDKYPETFVYGYDYHKIAGSWGPGAYWPHFGIHRHLHFADLYYSEIIKRGWT